MCTARVGHRNGQRFVFHFLRNGRVVSTERGVVPSNSWTVAFSVAAGGLLGNRALIGGRWRCELGVGAGEPVRIAFASGGPTQVVLKQAVCSTSDTRLEGRARICRRNEAAGGLPRVRSVTCSATVVAARGRIVDVQLLYRGRQKLKQRLLSSKVKIESLLQPIGVRFFARSGPLPAGPYICRLAIAKRSLAAVSFRISR